MEKDKKVIEGTSKEKEEVKEEINLTEEEPKQKIDWYIILAVFIMVVGIVITVLNLTRIFD